MKQFIVHAAPEEAQRALQLLLENAPYLDEASIPVGHGWGVSSDGRKFFVRRTKSGYSIHQDRPARAACKAEAHD
ncbi:hypothetical protein KIKIMORA_00630 [Brevundimonas phage vB_BpoS-Kikimora]|uniref:Uncharacterized protein n=1 Tax=Brevundimonas phage vB_BpoS-Kikimora TaxID=2948601 RepID=A0A9E7MRI1_9CAUD|nr:hypothetical protein KIKIMORA_00630 [Brevundimonas phage vB_BpoS-Kikimora]